MFTLSGTVVKGDQYGRKIGFPTANLGGVDFSENGKEIPFGIYAGLATLPKTHRVLMSAIVIGPEGKDGIPKVEAHLLDFHEDIYGEPVSLELRDFIRPFCTFLSELALIEAIEEDIEKIKKILS